MNSIMIFGSPISWVFAELFSLVLFFACLIHASKQENAIQKILEYFGFMIAGAIFENIGVVTHGYNYDLHRIMTLGLIPFDILFIEASIIYAGFNLIDYLNVPKWSKPLILGLFGSVQDISLDPSSINNLHSFNGVLSARWNWSFEYEHEFFNIPFQNFSGWIWMIAFYSALVMIGRWLFEKNNNKYVGYAYPFLAGLLTPVCLFLFGMFVLFGMPFFPFHDRTGELLMLIINYSIPLVVLFLYRNKLAAIDFKKSRIAFLIPISLHLFDLIVALITGVPYAIIPCVGVTIVHSAYFYYLYSKSKKLLAIN